MSFIYLSRRVVPLVTPGSFPVGLMPMSSSILVHRFVVFVQKVNKEPVTSSSEQKLLFPSVSWTRKQNLDSASTPPRPRMWAATSIFSRRGIDMGQKEKSEYYAPNRSNFSSLLVKWRRRCCKLETELIMYRVNRPQVPILPGITFKWLCFGIEVQTAKGNPSYLLLEVVASISHYSLKMRSPFVVSDFGFEMLMTLRCPTLRSIFPAWPFVMHRNKSCLAFPPPACFLQYFHLGVHRFSEMRLLPVWFALRKLIRYASVGSCRGARLIDTRGCFYEKSQQRGLVSLSEIISKAGDVFGGFLLGN